ncbi:TRAP transporter substrate-binding protein DctP, partial [Vibrio vulnificus]|uniref:TRAP transporter substrate-binding protein DctP n=1 Tax=Vibrio vulnificus TaxID=672 RepID=UPI0024E013AD
RDKDHYYKVTDGEVGREILNSSADSGFIGVTYYDAGARSFYTNKPINTPEDLKGLKVRVQKKKITRLSPLSYAVSCLLQSILTLLLFPPLLSLLHIFSLLSHSYTSSLFLCFYNNL